MIVVIIFVQNKNYNYIMSPRKWVSMYKKFKHLPELSCIPIPSSDRLNEPATKSLSFKFIVLLVRSVFDSSKIEKKANPSLSF